MKNQLTLGARVQIIAILFILISGGEVFLAFASSQPTLLGDTVSGCIYNVVKSCNDGNRWNRDPDGGPGFAEAVVGLSMEFYPYGDTQFGATSADFSANQLTLEVYSDGIDHWSALTWEFTDLDWTNPPGYLSDVLDLGGNLPISNLSFTANSVTFNTPEISNPTTGLFIWSHTFQFQTAVMVPNVVGLAQDAAQAALTNAGLMVGTVTMANSNAAPAGNVISQNPLAGTSVAPGAVVALVVSLGPANVAPSVNAGSDQTITLPNVASLDGTVTDDGLPSGTVTTMWAKVSGSGPVTFGNASAVDTTATFSQADTYVLRLIADDGALMTSAEVTITVDPDPTTFTCDGPSLAGSYSGVVEGKRNNVPYSAFLFLTVLRNGTLDVLSIFGEPGVPWQQGVGDRHLDPVFHHRWVLYHHGHRPGRDLLPCQLYGIRRCDSVEYPQ